MERPNASAERGDPDSELAEAGFPVVGIGASAGGLRALQSFFDQVPDGTGMAFVVIVHLDPDHESQMADLLRGHTTMPVSQVTQPVKVEPDHVYVIPPDRDLSMVDGHLGLSDRKLSRQRRAPIDVFFRTLADTHGSGAVGIILTGTGADGTDGIRCIKDRGGVTMAQAPADAEHDGMPRSAIATGQVDVVLPVAELAEELIRISTAESRIRLSGEAGRLEESDTAALARVLAHVRLKTGHDFACYKRSTVLRRIRRRMQFTGTETLGDYMRFLRETPEETATLFNDLLITVTSFFRDPESFDALEAEMPAIFAHKRAENEVRVWVTGCATGEEAYSIAILLCEQADRLERPPHIQIFATDVHEGAFSFAREGLYPESVTADISPARLERFFKKESGGYRVKKTLREKVLFATHDVLKDPPFLRLDLVSCRNLMIYLERDAQRQVLETFHYALAPNRLLFLGSSESADAAAELFAVADKKHRIFESVDVPQHFVPRTGASPNWARPVGTGSDPRPRDTTSFGALHHRMIEAYAPPSLVVNADEEIVHLSEGAGRYLRLGGGEPSRKLFDIVPGDLRLELRTLVHLALMKGKPGESRQVRIEVDGEERHLDLTVRPLHSDQRAGNFALVIFDEKPEPPSTDPTSVQKPSGGHARASAVDHLERELKETKSQLQANLEEHDATIEELKASNEELQAINEEQKATSEELETSREELQSMNEELRTINQEHRIRNEELLQVNSDLHNLMDSTRIATLFLDRDFRIRRYTPPIATLFNFVAADVGRPLTHMTHELEYPQLVEDARRVLQTLAPIEREVHGLDGQWFTTTLSPYRSLDDRIDGVVLTFIDVTERKRFEQEREQLLKESQDASGAKSNFISAMSHEIRTPLNAILGYADLLGSAISGPLTENQQQQVHRIRASAMHLADIIEEILVFSRVEAGQTRLNPTRFDLTELTGDVVSLMEPAAALKDLPIHVEMPSDPVVVVADVGKLRQIVLNLLANAVRYTDQGQITLRIRVDGETVLIEIEDTGLGIAPNHRERIFERFWQVDQTTTRTRGGSGLGLSVSRSLARLMGGDIELESELGKGSTFKLRLPLETEQAGATIDPSG
ncbi:MAG: chemotaxis protein CheB [Longimicrobiales bacterium]